LNDIIGNVVTWIRQDYKTNSVRFIVEAAAWVISIGCSITMALTVPNPPLIYIYPVFIIQCCMYGWASYSRRSFGMLANYSLLITIDSIGLTRMLTQ